MEPTDIPPLAPLARLLAAHAGADGARHALLWAFDARLADIVRSTTEPLIGQMRMTWWHDVLDDPHAPQGRGDPLADALRDLVVRGQSSAGLLAMIDGWELLLEAELDADGLDRFARGRGGGLFSALSGIERSLVETAGAAWALWDLSGHVSDAPLAEKALLLARGFVEQTGRGRDLPAKPLFVSYGLARADIMAGRRAPAALTPRLYGRFIRLALLGR